MSGPEKKKMQLLAIIVGLLGLSLYYSSSSDRTVSPPAKPVVQEHAASIPVQPASQMDELPALPLLNRAIPPFEQSERNVFQYGDEQNDADPAVEVAENEPETQEQDETAPDVPAGSGLTFVGLYVVKDHPDSRRAILSVNKNIILAKTGDLIPGGYRLVRIDDDSIMVEVIGQKLVLRFALGSSGVPVGG